jgi:anaphase-promoting complex subunit 2
LQEEFGKKYETIKPDKKLHWVHQMGTLKLAIELKDRTIEVTATPLEAAVIELFSEKRKFNALLETLLIPSSSDMVPSCLERGPWCERANSDRCSNIME